MHSVARGLGILAAGLGILAGCNREPVFPVQPKIEFLRISPDTVRALQDSIFITFFFQDGDGDLGAIDENDLNLHLIDSRINNGLTEAQATNKYAVPNLTPDARNPSIQGEITIKMPFTALQPGFAEQRIRYQIKFWDRSGNLATPLNDTGETGVYTDFITVVR